MKNKQILADQLVQQDHVGYELGSYAKKVLAVSNRQLQKAVRTRGLRLNGRIAHSKTKISLGDRVQVLLPQAEQIKIAPTAHTHLVILHEDSCILAVNKPAGLPSYDVHGDHGLANQVAGYFLSQGLQLTPRPLHRLDTPTSGVLLFAKNARSQTLLTELWQEEQVQRFYWALCVGQITKPLKLTMPINNQKAYTKVDILKNHEEFTELKVELVTGRTHQIRQHLAAINHPLVGDRRYGKPTGNNEENTRLALHATSVCFPHPQRNGQVLEITSPIPYEEFPFLNY